MTDRAHPNCHTERGHICQQPSGRRCVDCGEPAGTLWGPYWCPDCDMKRLDRITVGFEAIAAAEVSR